MTLPLVVLLMVAISTATALDPSFYTPQITTQPIAGAITASTFSLEQPLCIFDQSSNQSIWLLVAYTSAATVDLNTSKSPYFAFSKNLFYTTLETQPTDYPCVDTVSTIRVLRVGTDTSCVNDPTVKDCNGPLPSSGPYSVKFLIQDPKNPNSIGETRWSQPIKLQEAKNPASLDTFPGRRSGGMIVITSILSVLLAILLLSLIAMMIYGCNGLCWRKELVNKEHLATESFMVKRYNTHHMQVPARA